MMTDLLPPFDLQEIGRRVRARKNELEDRRSPLVREAHDLQRLCEKDETTKATLLTAVATVEKAGGDAARLRDQVSEINERLLPAQARLVAVNREWGLLNECCKWADYADTGLHWLVFAQCEMDKFDKVGVWAPDYHLTREALA